MRLSKNTPFLAQHAITGLIQDERPDIKVAFTDIPPHSHTLSLSFSHTHSLSLSLSLSHSVFLSLSLSLSLTRTLSLSLTRTLSLSRFLSRKSDIRKKGNRILILLFLYVSLKKVFLYVGHTRSLIKIF